MQPKRKHFIKDIRSLAGKYLQNILEFIKAWTVETDKTVEVKNT